ncbi:1784_t:CDS:2 [Dentiscutata erythropus]|uniref:1784_t:CDS:1 n=1 Tax=Dentiscutata erythropus TaxID=1348616 RepID=A0A9N9BUZ3_9GLOM|nr:1784_t:CDS:2 [Dentiscutata erythropus]
MTQPQTPPHTVDKNGVIPTLPTNAQENTESQDTSNQNMDVEMNVKASIIAKAWRNHREKQGKVLSSESRDKLHSDKKACLHLLDDGSCPVWNKWEELLNTVESQMHRKDSKMAFAVNVVERIGKGSCKVKDHMWLVLDTEHWLEICDDKHRYGANLKIYHDYWLKTSTPESFFIWLDEGGGKNLDLKARPRCKLESERVKYLSKIERADFEVTFKDGLLIYKKSGNPVHTNSTDAPEDDALNTSTDLDVDLDVSRDPSPAPSINDADDDENVSSTLRRRPSGKREKWIYVTDCHGNFYVGQKKKGHFHHSSFLAGGAIAAAGGIKAQHGKLMELNPKSGHYKPSQIHFSAIVNRLKDENVDLSNAKLTYPNDMMEKHLIAKYKVKRFADLALVYHQFVHDASNMINREIDYVDRHVTKFSSTFRKNVKSLTHEAKVSLRELFNKKLDNDKDDQIEVQALNTNDGDSCKSGNITNELPEGKIESNIIEEDSKVNQKRKSHGIFHEFRRSISSSISSLSSIIFGQDNKTDNDSSTGSRRSSFRDSGDYQHQKSRFMNLKLGHSKDGENPTK